MGLRSDIIEHVSNSSVAIELGTAEGKFTEQLILKNKFLHVYSIDNWDNYTCPIVENVIHDECEYKRALTRLDIYKERCSIFKLPFESAVKLFPDEYFDFVYIDGDPIHGENFGKTFDEWLPKVKNDGVIAGSNCSKDFPILLESLGTFSKKNNFQIHIHDFDDKDDEYCKYPSWFIKLNETAFEFPKISEV